MMCWCEWRRQEKNVWVNSQIKIDAIDIKTSTASFVLFSVWTPRLSCCSQCGRRAAAGIVPQCGRRAAAGTVLALLNAAHAENATIKGYL
jgi:hypothetical protein